MTGMIISSQQIASEDIPKIKIFPNPFTSNITIEGNNLSKVVIISENGSIVLTKPNLNGLKSLVLSLGNLSKGVYFVHITTDEGIIIKKIIKY